MPVGSSCRSRSLHIVIASETKRSIAPLAEIWIASAIALRATADKSSLSALAMTEAASKSYVIYPSGGVRHALVARWVLSRSDPAGADADRPSRRPIRSPTTTRPHQTGKKNRVKITTSLGSVCMSHLTAPMGANRPTSAAGKAQEQDDEFLRVHDLIRQWARAASPWDEAKRQFIFAKSRGLRGRAARTRLRASSTAGRLQGRRNRRG